jgi:aerobic-type carbon monoxide dehydrogenase small subunit (CoxS/CutS family)
MILFVYRLLLRNPQRSEPEIRRRLERNLCRCTG